MLHDIVGKRSEIIAVEDSDSIKDLIEILSSNHGKQFTDFVFDSNGKVRSDLAFAIDGSSIDRSAVLRRKCKGISEFAILPPISGGFGRLVT